MDVIEDGDAGRRAFRQQADGARDATNRATPKRLIVSSRSLDHESTALLSAMLRHLGGIENQEADGEPWFDPSIPISAERKMSTTQSNLTERHAYRPR